MAKSSDKVYQLLDEVWKPALAKAKEELADITPRSRKKAAISSRGLGLALLFREGQEG